MKALLAIYPTAYTGDFNLRGMYDNFRTGMFVWELIGMIPCWTPPFTRELPAPVVDGLTLNWIDIVNGRRTVKRSWTLSPLLFKLTHLSATHSRWQANLNIDPANTIGSKQTGIYDMDITDSAGRQFRSAPFMIANDCAATNYPIPVFSFKTISPSGLTPVISFDTNNFI